MTGSRRIASSFLLFVLLAIGTRVAHGHVGHPLLKADRVLAIVLGEPPTLEYVVRLAPSEIARARKAADVDGDGNVSQVEAKALLATWTTAIGRDVAIARGRGSYEASKPLGGFRQVAFEATGVEGPVADVPGPGARVAWTFAIPVDASDRMRIDDGLALAPFDHTEVIVKDTSMRPLLGLGDDPKSLAITPRLGWVDASRPGPKSFHIVWRTPPRSDLPIVPIAFAIGVVASLIWAVARKKR